MPYFVDISNIFTVMRVVTLCLYKYLYYSCPRWQDHIFKCFNYTLH